MAKTVNIETGNAQNTGATGEELTLGTTEQREQGEPTNGEPTNGETAPAPVTPVKTVGQRTTAGNERIVSLAKSGFVKHREGSNGVSIVILHQLDAENVMPIEVELSELINITENGIKRVADTFDTEKEAKKAVSKLLETGLSREQLIALLSATE